ncbi:universal stress protein [Zunongwangia sp. F363]|uniref:Universal stress protein n=1 Tax=Autumnicola tepida TaxID=3075595 RepID=A0ABU3CAL3_9FLAO|nr:universal stress protein [Zunongwangia sp. F363]MDT0643385.1 universal stress protein [Zunongwangia sp. F363]
MKKILVPTDFSDQAEVALKVAANLAKKFDSEIFLLHMLELPLQLIDPVEGSSSRNLPESIFFMKLAHQRFGKLMQRPFLEGIKVHESVQFHQAFEGIKDFSEEIDCDLIVMGSHGASGFKEMFIGSNTEKVVRSSQIPVLVIKNSDAVLNAENFVFATDASASTMHTAQKAVDFARTLGAALHLLYINTPNEFITSKEAGERLRKVAEITGTQPRFHIYNDVSVEKGILNFAAENNIGLIGIGTHGRKGLAHFFNGSISEDLVNHARRPVVTFKI